jgi:hypothetical protein
MLVSRLQAAVINRPARPSRRDADEGKGMAVHSESKYAEALAGDPGGRGHAEKFVQ